jgi:predicted transcriptional regulator
MKPVMQVINAAYARRPTNEVPFGETTNVAEVVGHFWRPEDLHGLPAELREILQETYEAEEQKSST